MKRVQTIALFALVLGCSSSAAWAAQQLPCKQIAATLCPGTKPGELAYDNCLMQHGPELPADCKRAVDAAAARRKDIEQFPGCIADTKKFCADSKAGMGTIMGCLRLHMSDLSEACKREVGKRTGRY